MSSHAFQTVPDQFRGSRKEEFLIPDNENRANPQNFEGIGERFISERVGEREQSQREIQSPAFNEDKINLPEHILL